ncbi:MAG: hypothetical protein ABUT20_00895 [Bacteroidota bacterium]
MKTTLPVKVHYILRIAVAMCFIGHGVFGIITKPVWCNYFAVFGIGQGFAYQLMPVVGSVDIVLGIIMLLYPVRAIPLWLVIWGLLTASLRPLSGEPFAELIERAGNFGAPLALLVLSGFPKSISGLFKRINPYTQPDAATFARLANCLRIVVFLLFLGHGWLNIIEKKGLLNQYSSIGFSDASQVAQIIGLSEIIAAFIVLIKPIRQFLVVLLLWKMASELFYPHHELFEWIERGGSYGTVLALWLMTGKFSFTKSFSSSNFLLTRHKRFS